MTNVVFYDNFQTALSNPFLDYPIYPRGPWSFLTDFDRNHCLGYTSNWCERCLQCYVDREIVASGQTYHYTIFTNIFIDPTRYGNAESLDFIWQYTAQWQSYNPSATGTFLVWTSGVGFNTYQDSIALLPADSTIRHTGWVPKPKTLSEFIPISINFTYTRSTAEYIGFFVKDLKFQITTPTSTPSGTNSPANNNNSSNNPSSSKRNTGAIVGGVVGSVVFAVLCLLIGFFVGKRKARQRQNNKEVTNSDGTANQNSFLQGEPVVNPVYQPPNPVY